jgi:hypothetical protein
MHHPTECSNHSIVGHPDNSTAKCLSWPCLQHDRLGAGARTLWWVRTFAFTDGLQVSGVTDILTQKSCTLPRSIYGTFCPSGCVIQPGAEGNKTTG